MSRGDGGMKKMRRCDVLGWVQENGSPPRRAERIGT